MNIDFASTVYFFKKSLCGICNRQFFIENVLISGIEHGVQSEKVLEPDVLMQVANTSSNNRLIKTFVYSQFCLLHMSLLSENLSSSF